MARFAVAGDHRLETLLALALSDVDERRRALLRHRVIRALGTRDVVGTGRLKRVGSTARAFFLGWGEKVPRLTYTLRQLGGLSFPGGG